MEFQPRVSVVVGVQNAWQNVAGIVDRMGSIDAQDMEIIFCHASDDPPPAELALPDNSAVLAGHAHALIPELWALGIASARGETVAILSANCIPDAHWIRTVTTLDLTTHVAFGGPIYLAETASGRDTAIHILRYCGATPPQPKREIQDVAADNSVYRRAEIMKHGDLLGLGFWEPSFHARFRSDGLTMAFEPDLSVAHVNTYTTRAFLVRRFEHGHAFGQERMSRFGPWKRAAMLALSPFAASFFAAKVIGRGVASPGLRWRLPGSLPWLVPFIAAWSLGEVSGYVAGLFGANRPCDSGETAVGSKVAVHHAVNQASKDRTHE